MNKTLLQAVSLLAIFSSGLLLLAQTPNRSQSPVTCVGSHRLGETVQEWLSINSLDLSAICQSRKREDKTVCKNLSAFRDGKTGTFFTTNDTKKKYEWLFIDGKVAEVSTGEALDFFVQTNHFAISTMQEQIGFLSQVYGPPTETQTVPYQNALGARWDCLQAIWHMQDGALITAVESVQDNGYGPSRSVTVRFVSSDRVRQLVNLQKSKPNPYAQ